MRIEGVISTTREDSQGERMSRQALENIVDSISSAYIPVGIEHDPRIPPQGRMDSAFIRETDDGEFEAVAILEFFEGNDNTSDDEDNREIVTRTHSADGLLISNDFTHRTPEDQADISAIAKIFGNSPQYDIKKAADPISIITIFGAFVLGGIASGFLGQIGIDAWELVKKKLSRVFERKATKKGENLLMFNALIEANASRVEIEIILANPSPQEIDWLLKSGLQIVDKVSPIYLQNSQDIRRLVFEASGSQVDLLFAVRKDCRPLTGTLSVEEILKKLDDR